MRFAGASGSPLWLWVGIATAIVIVRRDLRRGRCCSRAANVFATIDDDRVNDAQTRQRNELYPLEPLNLALNHLLNATLKVTRPVIKTRETQFLYSFRTDIESRIMCVRVGSYQRTPYHKR